MTVKNKSFWLSKSYEGFDALDDDIETEVAIIGGGITGVSAAHHLDEENVDFVLLEKGKLAGGATGHSMGGLVPGIEQEDIWQSMKKYGEVRTKVIWKASSKAIDEIVGLCKGGINCDLMTGSAFDLVQEKSELGFLAMESEAAARCGIGTRVLDREGIRGNLAVGDSVIGALEYTKCAQVNPAALVNGLAMKLKKPKTSIFEHTKANGIENLDKGFMIRTKEGSVKAKKLIIATESYTPRLGFLKNVMTSIRINVIATERLDDYSIAKLGLKNRMAWNFGRDYNFIRTTADNRVIIDGGDSLSAAHGHVPQQKRIDEIWSRLMHLFPMMANSSIEFEWSGRMAAMMKRVPLFNELIRSVTELIDIRLNLPFVEQIGMHMTSMPFLGYTGENPDIFCSAGYIGHGLPLGFLGGKVLSQMATGNLTEESRMLLKAYNPKIKLYS